MCYIPVPKSCSFYYSKFWPPNHHEAFPLPVQRTRVVQKRNPVTPSNMLQLRREEERRRGGGGTIRSSSSSSSRTPAAVVRRNIYKSTKGSKNREVVIVRFDSKQRKTTMFCQAVLSPAWSATATHFVGQKKARRGFLALRSVHRRSRGRDKALQARRRR